MTATRIVLCDDHPIVLAGLRNLIAAEPDLHLVGEVSHGLAALKAIRMQAPDIAILDISMPELNGLMLARRLAGEMPDVKLMMLTLYEERAYLKQALDAGVKGYVLKRSAAEVLVRAIRAVAAGELYIDPVLVDRASRKPLLSSAATPADFAGLDLTPRETEALKLTALGFTTKEAARRLDVGAKSIETYKARGMEKLGFKTKVDLVRYAASRGWLADL